MLTVVNTISHSTTANRNVQGQAEKKTELFAKLPLALWKNGYVSRMSGSAMKVLVLLMMRADFEKKTCWPSIATIARDTGLSKPTVINAINNLMEIALVRRAKRGNSFRYKLCLDSANKISLPGQAASDETKSEEINCNGIETLPAESNNLTSNGNETLHKQDTIELKPTTKPCLELTSTGELSRRSSLSCEDDGTSHTARYSSAVCVAEEKESAKPCLESTSTDELSRRSSLVCEDDGTSHTARYGIAGDGYDVELDDVAVKEKESSKPCLESTSTGELSRRSSLGCEDDGTSHTARYDIAGDSYDVELDDVAVKEILQDDISANDTVQERSAARELAKAENDKLQAAQNRLASTNYFERSKPAVGMGGIFARYLDNDSRKTSIANRKSRANERKLRESLRSIDSFKSTASSNPETMKPHYAKLPDSGVVDMVAYADMGVEQVEIVAEESACRSAAMPQKSDTAVAAADKAASQVDIIVRTFFNKGENAAKRRQFNRKETVRDWAANRLENYLPGSIIIAIAESEWAVRPEGVDKKLQTMMTRSRQAAIAQQREERLLAKMEQDKQLDAEYARMKAIPQKTTAEKIEMYRQKIQWCKNSDSPLVSFFDQRIKELTEQLAKEQGD